MMTRGFAIRGAMRLAVALLATAAIGPGAIAQRAPSGATAVAPAVPAAAGPRVTAIADARATILPRGTTARDAVERADPRRVTLHQRDCGTGAAPGCRLIIRDME